MDTSWVNSTPNTNPNSNPGDVLSALRNGNGWIGQSYRKGQESAANQRAAIARAQWQDYQQRFLPIEDTLLGMLAPGYVSSQATESLDLVNDSFANSAAATNRSLRSYGIQQTPEQLASTERQTNIQQSLSGVNAYNRSADAAEQRQFGILAGGYQRNILGS